MGVYDRGRRFYEECTREYAPLNPYELPQERLLQVLDINPRGASELVVYSGGNVFNLAEADPKDIEVVDGIGPASCAKLIALFALLRFYEAWREEQELKMAA
jgi:hypothetical protein